jgi:hypothetical protein
MMHLPLAMVQRRTVTDLLGLLVAGLSGQAR